MKQAPIYDIEVFLVIAREGSIRAAADVLGVGASAVSLKLKSLEQKMGVDLFFRTTRKVELTDAGRALFENASPAYRDLLYAVEQSKAVSKSTTGTLRISMSRGAYLTAVAPLIETFLAENPGINLDISWREELVDIVRSGIHAGIRLGDIVEEDMVAVRMTDRLQSAYFASPTYLETHGRPKHPRELMQHRCIRYRLPTAGKVRDWWFSENGQATQIDPPARLTFDTVLGVIQAAREGHGIGWSLRATMTEYEEKGELETILDDYVTELPPFYIYYPTQNKNLPCLRLFVDAIKRHRECE